MVALSWHQKLLLVIFFGLISMSMLAPIASDRILPDVSTFPTHTAFILQAEEALDEGQFPIRLAPSQHNGWRYPLFQYYSPFPYMLAASIDKVYKYAYSLGLTFKYQPSPFIAYKLMIWFFLIISAIYIFRLVSWVTQSRAISILSSVLYISAPYVLININTRGAFTEAIAQGLIPAVLYYTLRSYQDTSKHLSIALLTAFAWFALSTTHLITFVYTSFFVGLLLLMLTLKNLKTWKSLLFVGLLYCFSCLLASWYLIPIGLTTKYLTMGGLLFSPYVYHWLTPLTTLFSVTAVSPVPLGSHKLDIPLYASFGWPTTLGVGVIFYLFTQKKLELNRDVKQFILPLLILLVIAIFAVWSPINFWEYLPQFLVIAQFSYRLLAQVVWIGTLLFSFALLSVFKDKMDLRHVCIGILLIGMASSPWLHSQEEVLIEHKLIDLAEADKNNNYANEDYLVRKIENNGIFGNNELPLFNHGWWEGNDYWLSMDNEIKLPFGLFENNPQTQLKFVGEVPAHKSHKPIQLIMKLNGKKVISKSFKEGKFIWEIPIGKLIPVHDKKLLLSFEMVDQIKSTDLINKEILFRKKVSVLVKSLTLTNIRPAENVLTLSDTTHSCSQNNEVTNCNITVPTKSNLVQLPILYYPKLLELEVNGVQTDYFPIGHKGYYMVGLKLNPGSYTITAKFVGIRWANWMSLIAWTILLSGIVILPFLRIRKNSKIPILEKI